MKRWASIFILSALGSAAVEAQILDSPEIELDPVGDAVLRRTDPGADGLVNPGSNLPDIKSAAIGSWSSPNPSTNPFNGFWVEDGDSNLFRIDLTFEGLLNPPGPNGLSGPVYDPYEFGPSPLYGFLEINIDDDVDTGGEIDFVAHRYMGNAARFGAISSEELGPNTARSGDDLDFDLLTPPLVERSGEELHFSLCGCDEFLIIEDFGDPTPQTFDAGDRWVLFGRFLHRMHPCSEYSFAFGGSAPGEYDPLVSILFAHVEETDETVLSIVYALDQSGAADLAGENEQDIDLNAGNHSSILELLFDIWFTAVNTNDPGNGTPFDLIREWVDWEDDDLQDLLQPVEWELNALFGTAYAEQEANAFYVWTDVGFDIKRGDLNGDDDVDRHDQNLLMSYVTENDAGGDDDDRFLNGQIRLPAFGLNFSIYDINYDGAVNGVDLLPLGYQMPGDVNLDRARNNADLVMVRNLVGTNANDPEYNPAADLTRDGRITNADLRLLWKLINSSANSAPSG